MEKMKKQIVIQNNLAQAITEAQRFIDTAQDYYAKIRNDKFAPFGCKESSACKRASMDLTRSLVKVRNP